jgi:hypothetical protein
VSPRGGTTRVSESSLAAAAGCRDEVRRRRHGLIRIASFGGAALRVVARPHKDDERARSAGRGSRASVLVTGAAEIARLRSRFENRNKSCRPRVPRWCRGTSGALEERVGRVPAVVPTWHETRRPTAGDRGRICAACSRRVIRPEDGRFPFRPLDWRVVVDAHDASHPAPCDLRLRLRHQPWPPNGERHVRA